MRVAAVAVALFLANAVGAVELPETPVGTDLARRLLLETVYFDRRDTAFCGCEFSADGRLSADCGGDSLRLIRLFQTERYGAERRCWREPQAFPGCFNNDDSVLSAAECCAIVDPVFGSAYTDLTQLWPVRNDMVLPQNYRWGELGQTAVSADAGCGLRFDSQRAVAEPPPMLRGDVARVMLYMEAVYGFALESAERALFERWHRDDPISDWERERNRRVTRLQERGNPLIKPE